MRGLDKHGQPCYYRPIKIPVTIYIEGRVIHTELDTWEPYYAEVQDAQ